jgi:uncharacterized cupredoxin-like copper-binding protein
MDSLWSSVYTVRGFLKYLPPPASSLFPHKMRRTVFSLLTIALAASANAQGRTVTVMASDFKFDFPDTVASGLTTFQLMNHGPELHHMQIIRLEQGKTMADFQAAMQSHGPPPAWVSFLGGPNAGVPDGRSSTIVTTNLTPGQYVALCVIPSPDGKPHVAKGMVKPFVVKASGPAVAQAGIPKADYVMTLYDYNFDLDKPLKAGRRTIQIKNTAKQFHEAFIAKLPPGVPPTALLEWMAGGMKGVAPAMPAGGIVGLSPGQENFLTVDLEPGEYALYCFLPAPDGKEHVAHGMLKQISVTK